MRKSRFSEEQIIGILKEHQAGLAVAEERLNRLCIATFTDAVATFAYNALGLRSMTPAAVSAHQLLVRSEAGGISLAMLDPENLAILGRLAEEHPAPPVRRPVREALRALQTPAILRS